MGEEVVLVRNIGRCLELTLNRPSALNALNEPMVKALQGAYRQAAANSDVEFVLLRGTGTKAFCAGGDVRAIYDNGEALKRAGRAPSEADLVRSFFKQEYVADYMTHKGKPQVAILDGITMGGGVGISVHGRFRVCTERSMFAMPETAIGFFPDVGGSHFLSQRMAPPFGRSHGLYLGLSGARLKGAELVLSGIATHYVPSARLDDCVASLRASNTVRDVENALENFQEPVALGKAPGFVMFDHRDAIERCFSAETVEEMLERLRADGSEFCNATADTMLKMSPTSLKVSLEQIRRGSSMTLSQCLAMEYRMSLECMQRGDFFEGVRSVLVDKDRNPKWSPASLTEVSAADVQRFFAPLPNPADELALD